MTLSRSYVIPRPVIINYKEYEPNIGDGVFVAETATVLGRVMLGEHSSIWYGAVLRGDINEIRVGRYSNIQDLCIGHVEDDRPLIIGDYVTVGHSAILHGCIIRDGALIGMGATVLDGAELGKGSLVAAGSLVPPRTTIPRGVLAMGTPVKIKRELTPEEIAANRAMAKKYARHAAGFLER